MREKLSADSNWKFHLGDFKETRNHWSLSKSGSWNEGPESMGFYDSDWETVTLPHDYVITSELTLCSDREFDAEGNAIPEMQSVYNMHTTAGSFKKEIAWYRKHFYIPKEYDGKRLTFVFDGIYRNSSVYVNNFFIKSHDSGYTELRCDITDFAVYGGENVISVRVDPTAYEGWFYTGGGIYRHTYLEVTEQSRIENIFVSSDVDLNDNTADVRIKLDMTGDMIGSSEVSVTITDMSGNIAAEGMFKASESFDEVISLKNITLWDINYPHLYTVKCALISGGREYDSVSERFGIRDIRFDADKGFFLNGRGVKLRGVCCHQNHGGVGSAMPDTVIEYRIKRLKELGANAYRTSHYPQTKEILDACDKYGLLVMDETRLFSSAETDLEQLDFLVRRGRNHPSVIMYSIGNEEAQSQTSVQSARIAGTMIRHIKALDKTRPVTMALLLWDLGHEKPIESISEIAGISEQLDIAGFNYHEYRWEDYHKTYPNQPMICTEQGTFKSTRGCYEADAEKCCLSIIDKSVDSYMKGAEFWALTAETPYICGSFLWTGFDYYGEPTPFAWPAVSSQFGIMDICGEPKDFWYYYKAEWTDMPLIHAFPAWTGTEGEKKDMHVFTNCASAELVVNGKSLGRKTREKHGYLEWDGVSYAPGEITAIGYDENGNEIAKSILKTPGKAASVSISVGIKKDGIAVLNLHVKDSEKNTVPYADNEFELITDAELLGAANGNPAEHTSVLSRKRRFFNGFAQVILKFKPGDAVSVLSEGLTSDKITL